MVGTSLGIIAEKGTKNQIIQILSESPPLTAKEIHNTLARKYSTNFTYQSTHKTIKLLFDEQVLTKSFGNTYSISEEWVADLQKQANLMAEKRNEKHLEVSLSSLKEGNSLNLNFKGIPEVGWFLIDKVMVSNLNPEKQPGLALWKHCYSLMGLPEKYTIGIEKAFSENEWHLIVEEDNEVDKMFGETLKSLGAKEIRYGVHGCSTKLSDKTINGNYIAEIIYPRGFRAMWELQNRLPKKLVEFNIAKHFMAMRSLEPKINVIVTKNSKLADEYRKEYLTVKEMVK